MRYSTPSADFADERAYLTDRADLIGDDLRMNAMLDRNPIAGEGVLSIIYSYRGVSRAIPLQTDDSVDKTEVSEKRYEVLRPEVLKMKQLMAFQEKSAALIVDVRA